jgi:hypothetical protein
MQQSAHVGTRFGDGLCGRKAAFTVRIQQPQRQAHVRVWGELYHMSR